MGALWIKTSSGGGIKFNFWDKPNRNRNKLNLSVGQRKALSMLGGREKKTFLKEMKA